MRKSDAIAGENKPDSFGGIINNTYFCVYNTTNHANYTIHIEYQGQSAKIQVCPEIAVIENNGIKAQTMKKALEAVDFYRKDIIEAWNEIFTTK